jgi:anti-sigma regulatory factor (Ser/Thr protein kinase)
MTQALKDGNTVLTSCDPDMACFIEKEFEADDKQLHVVLSFLEEELEKRGAGRKEMMGLSLALEEAFVNVAHYAYEGKEPGKVWISLAFEGDDVSITLKDQGMEFDPLENKDPDITLKASERKIGGLGIYMIKKTADAVKYERKDGYNILTMKKTYR